MIFDNNITSIMSHIIILCLTLKMATRHKNNTSLTPILIILLSHISISSITLNFCDLEMTMPPPPLAPTKIKCRNKTYYWTLLTQTNMSISRKYTEDNYQNI